MLILWRKWVEIIIQTYFALVLAVAIESTHNSGVVQVRHIIISSVLIGGPKTFELGLN